MIIAKLEIQTRGFCRVTEFEYDDNAKAQIVWSDRFHIAEILPELRRAFLFNAAAMPPGTVVTVDERGEIFVSDYLGIAKRGRPTKGDRAMTDAERARAYRQRKREREQCESEPRA